MAEAPTQSTAATTDAAVGEGIALRILPLVVALVSKLVVSLVVLASGFRALSDDDYARVVIAERFAVAPTLDPSGTSWLPLPFWIYGVGMAVLERNLLSARIIAVALGLLAVACVYLAARWLDAPRKVASGAAILAGLFPYSSYLGVATLPEAPTAGLLVLGAVGVASPESRRRWLGALAIAAACASRYEAWAVAAAAIGVEAWRWLHAPRRKEGRTASLSCLLLSAFPVAWLLHGVLRHGDAFFFVKRVANYQHALGGANGAWLEELLRYPRLLFTTEPELMLLALGTAVLAAWRGPRAVLTRFRTPALLLAALLLFAMATALRQSGATHHPERLLLPLWTLAAIVVAHLGYALTNSSHAQTAWVGLAVAAIAGVSLRAKATDLLRLQDRSEAIAIGQAAREHVPLDGRLVVATEDYAYFAVLAAFGRPEDAVVADDHDPRRPGPERSLAEQLGDTRELWIVIPKPHAAPLETVAENSGFILGRATRY